MTTGGQFQWCRDKVRRSASLLSLLVAMAGPCAWTERLALVVGNSAYVHPNVPQLPNPRNDAADVATTLRGLDFQVYEAYDVDRQDFQDRLQEFDQAAFGAEMVIVFYAGHGMEMDKYNYLIPVDARLANERAVKHETIPLSLVLESVAGAKGLGVVILDACRDNPFANRMRQSSTTRSFGRGLAATDVGGGVLVHYAAKDGTTASDGEGRNSPYTTALLRYLNEPGIEVGMMFRKVRDAVVKATNGLQEPFRYGSLPAISYFLNPGQRVEALAETSLPGTIETLLQQAETNLAIDRLTRPPEDNAAGKFRRVLALDSGNERARRGLREVAARYEVLIRAAIDEDALNQAARLIAGLASLSPEHPRLSDFEGEIAAKTRAAAAGSVAPSNATAKPSSSTVRVTLDDEDRAWAVLKDDCSRDGNGEPGSGPSRYLRDYPGGRYESEAIATLLSCRMAP